MDWYLDLASCHPIAYKIAVVRTPNSMAQAISSSVLGKNEETNASDKQRLSQGSHTAPLYPHLLQDSWPEGHTWPTDNYVRGASEADESWSYQV